MKGKLIGFIANSIENLARPISRMLEFFFVVILVYHLKELSNENDNPTLYSTIFFGKSWYYGKSKGEEIDS